MPTWFSTCPFSQPAAGVHATDGATARIWQDNGCALVTVISDAAGLSRAVAAELATAQDREG